MKFNVNTKEKYFLVPEMPTPNGRMHLGHVSGPYLKLDILKRKTIRNGGQAFVVSGSDVYESYVEIKSEQTGREINDICNDFHGRILEDLRSLLIDVDMFVNPLDADIHPHFLAQHDKMVEELERTNSLIDVEEIFHIDPEKGRYYTGCWISGKCPNCRASTGSYLCENCGTHYKPMDIFDIQNYPEAVSEKRTSKFVKLDGKFIESNLVKMGVESSFVDIFREYIKAQGEKVRLTTMQKIGVPYKDSDQVLYTYTSLWFFSVFCGEQAKMELGLEKNPFEKGSDFITIASFGIDNAIPYLGGVYGAGLASEEYKAFDHLFSNFFYQLNGAKFSTSRLHVIWGKDILDRGEISPDLTRYYLTLVNPQSETKNFDTEEFVSKANEFVVEEHNTIIKDASEKMAPFIGKKVSEVFPKKWFSTLERLLQRQDEALNPFKFQLKDMCSTIDEWFEEYRKDFTASECFWWLKAYSLLSNPILVESSSEIAQRLSNSKGYTLENFTDARSDVFADVSDIVYMSVELEKLQLCLVNNEV